MYFLVMTRFCFVSFFKRIYSVFLLRADRSGRQVLLYSLEVSCWRVAVRFKYKIAVVVVVVVVVVAAAAVVVLFHFEGIQATGNLTPSIGDDLHSLHGSL